jgi:hypothetical protein
MAKNEYIGKCFKVEEDEKETGYLGQIGECVEFSEKGNVLALKFNDGKMEGFPLIALTMTGPGAGDGVLFPKELEKGKMLCLTQVIVSMPEPVDKVEVIYNKEKGKFFYHIKHPQLGDVIGVGATLNEAEKEFKRTYKKKALEC